MIDRNARSQGDLSRESHLTSAKWQVVPIGEQWTEQFRSFKNHAFRLEVLQEYAEPSEKKAFEEFLTRGVVSPEFISDWCDMVAQHVEQGRSMSRVHVVDLPLSKYLLFEIEGAYKYTIEAGEDISMLDRATLSPELQALAAEDFWLFDDSKVMVQDYSQAGALLHSRITEDPKLLEYYRGIREEMLKGAMPLRDFYKLATGSSL